MIIRKTTKVIYNLELTEQQAKDLIKLLETGDGGHVNELSVQASHGTEVANSVRETCNNLLETLENR